MNIDVGTVSRDHTFPMLLRGDGPLRVIGHRGAAALAPENTLRSFGRAIELGVDAVELDVLALADGTLVVAHSDDLFEVSHGAASGSVRERSLEELRAIAPELPTFTEALAFLGERAPETWICVDLKCAGCEAAIVEELRRRGALDRAFVSTCLAGSLRAVATLEPALGRALTYPFDRRGVSGRPSLAPAVRAGTAALRLVLPSRIRGLLERAEATAAALHFSVVTPAVVDRCHAGGRFVVAWTVDDPAEVRRLDAAGVDAVVTNDPRIAVGTLTP